MRRLLLRLAIALPLLLLATGAIAAWWSWRLLHRPFRGYEGEEIRVEVGAGSTASEILDQLEREGILPQARLARAYLLLREGEATLKAGEYRFSRPLSTPEVLERLIRGEIVTHPVTVIEGLTLEETASALADSGFGSEEAFLVEMRSPARILDLDPDAADLEGYLFPDTYSFARGAGEDQIVDLMVSTFRRNWEEVLAARSDVEPDPRELVTLASIVEKEALLDDERPLIAGVYRNRLRRGIALYADPTVIYALKLRGTWDGNLRRPDLELDSPYNTYRYPGLPPGPICSPGLASLLAAADPAQTDYLYFVSRNDGTHVFASTLREHNRNVERWQRRYWRERWRREVEESIDSADPGG